MKSSLPFNFVLKEDYLEYNTNNVYFCPVDPFLNDSLYSVTHIQ